MNKFKILKSASVFPDREDDWLNEIPKAMKRRAPRIWRMAHVAVARALKDSNIKPKSVITATALGALDETVNFLNGSFSDGFGSPRNFIASVHNSMAGNIAMNFGIKGPNLTICDSQNSLASSIVSASFLSKNDFPVLLVAVDERTELLETLHQNFSSNCKDTLPKDWIEGAFACVIDKHTDGQSISADGPMPLNGLNYGQVISSITSTFEKDGFEILDINKCSDSFIAPAVKLDELIKSHASGKKVIPAYSPTSRAVSFIKIEL